MDYTELTDAQKDYLRKLNDTRAKLVSVAYDLQQRVAELTRAMLDAQTPREEVAGAHPALYPVGLCLKDAHERLGYHVERIAEIETVAQTQLYDLRYRLRELDPTVWKSRLNGSDAQSEPARDAAEEIYCERNED